MPKAIDIMKEISTFDPETSFDDREARKNLSFLFNQLVMNDEPQAREYFERFLTASDDIIADMGIIERPEDASPDDIIDDMPDEELPAEEPASGDEEDQGIPDDLLGAGFDPLISMANGFLNY